MSIAEGHFRLYSRVTPALKAGLYRFTAHQDLAADGPDGALAAAALPVEDLGLHVDVTSPRAYRGSRTGPTHPHHLYNLGTPAARRPGTGRALSFRLCCWGMKPD